MTLPISTTIIRNSLGYLQCDISGLFNHLNTIYDPNSSQADKDAAGRAGNIGAFVSMKI